MLCHAVDWHKRKDQRTFVDILLKLGVAAVHLVLSKLEAASTAKHYVDDADIAKCGDDPLPKCAACAEADDKTACPH